MPAPELEWKVYEVAGDTADEEGRRVAPAPAVEIEIPVLTAFPAPRDKARILLETAAEIEHALLVQYLYAAYSLKRPADVADPAQRKALEQWSAVLLETARDEMGHLMTVQNLLLSLGLPPNLEREDFPPVKKLYPFELHLEPLTQRSLAKYVAAEAPEDPEGIEEIIAIATESAGTSVNRVGVLYGLLGVVFSTEQAVTVGTSTESWDVILRRIARAAHDQAPAASWHLDGDAIDPATLGLQADESSWAIDGVVRVFEIADRAAALAALRDVAEQGEGPAAGGEDSHFERYLSIWEGGDGIVAFPAGEWTPALAVPTDPKPGEISDPRTRGWCQLADMRYALLLGFIEHHLLTTDEDDRANLASWSFGEMFSLASLARTLATLPLGSGVAALPFTLPEPLHLPAGDTERWALQRARAEDAIEHVMAMQADAADPLLAQLLATDTSRLALMHGEGAPPPTTTSFARDILSLFRAKDIEHMIDQVDIDMTKHDVVRSFAASISGRLKGQGGRIMPPPPDQPLSEAQIALFDRWVAEGFPE